MLRLLSKCIIAGALTGCSFFCAGQPYHNSAGARWGQSSGFTFRQMQTDKHAIEAMLTFRWGGTAITGLYERYYGIGKSQFVWYWGGGLHLGYHRRTESKQPDDNLYINVGADIIAGMEYVFPTFPLNISFDFKPAISFTADNGNTGELFGLSVRYRW